MHMQHIACFRMPDSIRLDFLSVLGCVVAFPNPPIPGVCSVPFPSPTILPLLSAAPVSSPWDTPTHSSSRSGARCCKGEFGNFSMAGLSDHVPRQNYHCCEVIVLAVHQGSLMDALYKNISHPSIFW